MINERNKHMLKNYLITVFGIILVAKVGLGILKFMFSAKARRRNAIFYRLKKIVTNWVCKPLDNVIDRQQKEKVINSSPKIIKMPKQSNVK